jgi:NADPH-dependent 2,4-dienoyl-CoA reductase/sulfur reductase-like enzyme
MSVELNFHSGLRMVEASPASYDVIIIGGGPVGTSAAIYTARADLRTLVIDKGLTAGALGITSKIINYPGVLGPITGAELVETMRQQATSFGAAFLNDKVVGVDLNADPKLVIAGTGTFQAKAIVLATGSMGRTHTLPGEAEFLGRGVSYCATCDGAFFRDQVVAVVGGNDEALEEALFLTKFAPHVHLIVPSRQLRALNCSSDDGAPRSSPGSASTGASGVAMIGLDTCSIGSSDAARAAGVAAGRAAGLTRRSSRKILAAISSSGATRPLAMPPTFSTNSKKINPTRNSTSPIPARRRPF